jgi:hypothetical protein
MSPHPDKLQCKRHFRGSVTEPSIPPRFSCPCRSVAQTKIKPNRRDGKDKRWRERHAELNSSPGGEIHTLSLRISGLRHRPRLTHKELAFLDLSCQPVFAVESAFSYNRLDTEISVGPDLVVLAESLFS